MNDTVKPLSREAKQRAFYVAMHKAATFQEELGELLEHLTATEPLDCPHQRGARAALEHLRHAEARLHAACALPEEAKQ